jgi:hypothetical protein
MVTAVVVALLCLFAPSSSAAPLLPPQTRVAAIEHPAGQLVGRSETVLPGGSRPKAPNYDRYATGSCVAAEDGAGVEFRSDTSHIFRDAPGHLLDDSPANRALLQGAVKPENLVGTNQWGISTYQEILPDGSQVWVEVRNGTTITNGGVNNVPRP